MAPARMMPNIGGSRCPKIGAIYKRNALKMYRDFRTILDDTAHKIAKMMSIGIPVNEITRIYVF